MTDRYTDEAKALLARPHTYEQCVARVADRLRELSEAMTVAADALGNAAGCNCAPQCDGVNDEEVTRIAVELRRAALARKESIPVAEVDATGNVNLSLAVENAPGGPRFRLVVVNAPGGPRFRLVVVEKEG